MEDIELLIRISREDYEIMKHNISVNNPLCPLSQEEMVATIASGMPLPKGHRKLIAEPTEEDIAKAIDGQNDFAECIRDAVKTVFDNAKAIIKEDRAENEG